MSSFHVTERGDAEAPDGFSTCHKKAAAAHPSPGSLTRNFATASVRDCTCSFS